ncbi:hypothetical protein KVR01_010201 [Diaporthe batatas]|uniref:uncharacterized protein n=1 Tax=Diaporthe batatas TaxID=748121 RepID=UPI001D04061A|nr:uncharacterized protein KVR01_010201 [Diaporthe batatas]KAG8159564.1 hypothetical protein KVR01_010201 [Diaporthe batatas]
MASNASEPNNQPNTSDDARAELTQQLDDLLNTLSNKFAGVSSEIFAKMDEMSRRIDSLEAALMANNDRDSGTKQS